jgi:hypothetical protein
MLGGTRRQHCPGTPASVERAGMGAAGQNGPAPVPSWLFLFPQPSASSVPASHCESQPSILGRAAVEVMSRSASGRGSQSQRDGASSIGNSWTPLAAVGCLSISREGASMIDLAAEYTLAIKKGPSISPSIRVHYSMAAILLRPQRSAEGSADPSPKIRVYSRASPERSQ